MPPHLQYRKWLVRVLLREELFAARLVWEADEVVRPVLVFMVEGTHGVRSQSQKLAHAAELSGGTDSHPEI